MPRPSRNQFDQLVREHHAAVYRSVLRLSPCAEDAADVVQEVFVRVLRGKVRLAVAQSERATLCWLATRLASNARRSARRRSHHEEVAMNQTLESQNVIGDPARQAADAELRRTVHDLVARLPRELRLPVQMRCQDELTFAAIGSAMAVSESTAHERFERAIVKLRDWLRGSALGVAGASLPELVAAAPVPQPPMGLEGRLLALSKASALASVGVARRFVLFTLAATAAIAVTVASTMGSGSPTAPPAARVAAVLPSSGIAAQDPPAVRRPVPLPAPLRPAKAVQDPMTALGTALGTEPAVLPHFTGTVHDADAVPTVGVRVSAVAGGGLKPFELGSTVTGAGGAFALTLQPGKLFPGIKVAKLRVAEGSMQLLETKDLVVPAPNKAEPLALVLPASVGTEASRHVLSVTVLDSDGVALAGVPVIVYSGAGAKPRPGYRGEAEATTDSNGIAELRGRIPGAKWLFVDAREQGHALHYDTIAIDGPGAHSEQVRLARGSTLQGTVRALDDSSLDHVMLWLEDGHGVQYPSKPEADGRVTFKSLGSGEHDLHMRGRPFSEVTRRGLLAGGEPFHLDLKRSDDPSDIGDHMAELHGRLVDVETGEEIEFGGFDVECVARGDGESSLPTDACKPPAPVQRSIGSYKFEAFHETGLAAGRWVLIVRVEGYAAMAFEFTLRENEVKSDLRLPLSRGADLHGRVVDESGAPVKGATVFLAGVGELPDRNLRRCDEQQLQLSDYGRWPSRMLCSAWTRADGTFVVRGVPPGIPVRVVAWKVGHRMLVQAPNVYRAGGDVHDLELRLPQR